MTHRLWAIYEGGGLGPLKPLPLEEQCVVEVAVSDDNLKTRPVRFVPAEEYSRYADDSVSLPACRLSRTSPQASKRPRTQCWWAFSGWLHDGVRQTSRRQEAGSHPRSAGLHKTLPVPATLCNQGGSPMRRNRLWNLGSDRMESSRGFRKTMASRDRF